MADIAFTPPTMTDGYVDGDGNPVPGTICNKNWWDNTLFAWILGMVEHANYVEITPAELIEKVLTGNLNPPLYAESASTHTLGGLADNTEVYVRASQYVIVLTSELFWLGDWADFGNTGNCEVAAFSDADYYKHIALGLIENGGSLEFETTESAESATSEALDDPPEYVGTWQHIANIIVQNNGVTGVAGSINAITQSNITAFGILPYGTLPDYPLALNNGGTNNESLVADNGGIVYSDTEKLMLLASTATAGQLLRSGASSAPSWSTLTIPATIGIHELLYASAANVLAAIAAGNNSLLITNGSGVPAFGTDIPTAVTIGTAYIYRVGGTDIAQADGGTGIDSSGVTDGQLLIGGTGNDFALATITGTANRITVSNGDHSITLNTPQDLHTAATVQFAQMTLGNTGLIIGISTPFSDNAGTLTLQNIDAIDATTQATFENTLSDLAVTEITVLGTTGGITRKKSETTANITTSATVTIQVNIPSGSKILGCQLRVDSALASGELWDAEWNDGATIQSICTGKTVAQNTKVSQFFDENATTPITNAETDIVISKNGGGLFTAQGTIRAIAFYEEFETIADI